MRNPLRKRILRELKSDWKKYLALFLLLTVTIGFVSGMFVANDSMETAALEAYGKYNIEDGHFELLDPAADALLSAFEDEGIVITPQFYKDFDEDADLDGEKDATVRVFVQREQVNRACLMAGEFPREENEIVIDRMHADNSGIQVGDTIALNGHEMKVTGLVAFSDYSTLYESNTDLMFNALTFNIAAVTPEGYAALPARQTWQYAFQYRDRPETVARQKERADQLVEQLAVLALTGGMLDDADEADALKENVDSWTAYLEDVQAQADALEAQSDRIDETVDRLEELEPYEDRQNELTDFVPEYANQAIHFAPDDMGSDKAMGEVLLIILVAVLAFIFAITASSTITSEAAAIGTLRASGYTRGELLIHYVTVPVLVTLLSALLGNVLGYAVFKNVVVGMYYNSYSLPTYVTLWNADAFIKTTLYPVLLTVAVNLLVVYRKLRIPPLQFLRHDLSRSRRKKAVRLPKWGFFRRFRLRILFQNMAGYLTLFLGIFFVMVLLAFSVGMPATLRNYQNDAPDLILADYQYVLKSAEDGNGDPITTAEPSAEAYSMTSLKTVDGVHIGEGVTAYGYMDGSRYFSLPAEMGEGEVWVSSAFADKFSLHTGERLTLQEKYTEKTYAFSIAGVYELPGTIAVFLPNAAFNRTFGYDPDSFTGYLSRQEITDIDPDLIVSVITVEDFVKMAKQLDHSMGDYMNYFAWVCVLVAMLIIFLLTKLIIERNTVSISMAKVLGYDDREINRLYIWLTTIVVVLSSIVTAFLSALAVRRVWAVVMYRLNGWFTFTIGAGEILRIIVMVIAAYLAVALVDMRRIRRIPLTEALKNVE